jgi:hypothetical protein
MIMTNMYFANYIYIYIRIQNLHKRINSSDVVQTFLRINFSPNKYTVLRRNADSIDPISG